MYFANFEKYCVTIYSRENYYNDYLSYIFISDDFIVSNAFAINIMRWAYTHPELNTKKLWDYLSWFKDEEIL